MSIRLAYFQPLFRSYHLSSINYAAVHKTFRKVMGVGPAKKRKFRFQDAPILQDATKLSSTASEGKSKGPSKRIAVLSKLFMRYITDLMVNGEYWEQYAKFGIEISRIKVSSDCKNLHIFWVAKRSDNDDVIANFLSKHAFTLRHELSQLRVIGNVPPIVFVKDKHQSLIMDLDNRMAIADFGVDYEPTSLTRLKHQLELYSPLEEKIKIQIEKLEDDQEENVVDTDLPEMPQNVFGLDHAEMLSKLRKLMKKSESGLQIRGDRDAKDSFSKIPCEGDVQTDKLSSRDAFKLFLRKRQLINQKMNKELKNYNPDMEYIKQELKEKSSTEHYDNIESNLHNFEEDFIEEDTETK